MREPLNECLNTDEVMLNTQEKKDEANFTKYNPLLTVLLFSVGPSALLAQAVFETIDTLIVASRFKKEPESNAMAIIGATPLPIMICTYLCIFFGQAITATVSKILAKGDKALAARVVVDILRCAIIAGIIFPICYIWAVKPLLKFVNCSDEILDAAYRFCRPMVFGTSLVLIMYVCLNYLQAIGRPILTFLVKIAGNILQVFILTPTFVLLIRVSTDNLKIAPVCAQGVMGITLLVLILRGKFSLPISPRMFLEPFARESFHSLLVASPIVLLGICYILPPNVMLRCMNNIDSDHANEISAVMGVWNRFYSIACALAMTFGSGFLSPGTHALGRGDGKRMWKLFGWAVVLDTIPVLFFTFLVVGNPALVAKGFLTTDIEIEYAKKILPIPFYTSPLQSLGVLGIMLLMALGNAWLSGLVGIFQCVFGCCGALIAQHKVAHPWDLLYLFNVSDVMAFITYAVALVIYIKRWKGQAMLRGETSTSEVGSEHLI